MRWCGSIDHARRRELDCCMRLKGTVIEWNDDRGFGFIEAAVGGQRTLFDVNHLEIRARRPRIGERVTYELSTDKHRRPCAAHVRASESAPPAEIKALPPKGSPRNAIIVSAIFAIAVVGLMIARLIPWLVPVIYLCVSL